MIAFLLCFSFVTELFHNEVVEEEHSLISLPLTWASDCIKQVKRLMNG